MFKRAKSGHSSVGSNSLIYEPETVRLQRDIEKITQKLEHEKRESNYLDERIEMMNHEISLIKQKEKPPKINPRFNNLSASLQILEKKLEFEVIQLNEAKANNRKIRSVIDEFRLERLSYKRSLFCLQEDLHNYSNQAEAKNIEYRRGEELDQKQKSKISMLRCKSASEQTRYGEKVSQLTSVLQDEKQKRSKIFKIMEQEVLLNLNRPIEGIEVSRMLKKILEKWSNNTKEKKKQLDAYTKHIKVVEDAFKQIQQATGISSIEEIVTAFIKSQEQNYEIYTYMNNLTSEIDSLEDNLEIIKSKISLIEEYKENGEKKENEIKIKLEKDCEHMDKKIKIKRNKLENLRNEIQSITQAVVRILKLFESLNLEAYINQKLDKTWLENFSEETLINVLGYIEDYINYILILQAYSSSSDNPMLKHLPLDAINNKDFEVKNFDLKNILEAKDLYEDKEFDEIKNPLPVSELKNKAILIFEKNKNNNETGSDNQGFLNSFSQK